MGRFRCLAFRGGQQVDLRSRNQRPLGRYFPELVEALAAVPVERFVLDGEIVAMSEQGADFPALLARLHPAASRVERLRRETPALFIAFDLIAVEDSDLRSRRFAERRARLERLLAEAASPLVLTPLTSDRAQAEEWLAAYQGAGVDGVVAKHHDLRYEEGARRMVKVKHERTADCVVAGFRTFEDRPLPSSLLLGLYDDSGVLHHVGIASSFTEQARANPRGDPAPHRPTLWPSLGARLPPRPRAHCPPEGSRRPLVARGARAGLDTARAGARVRGAVRPAGRPPLPPPGALPPLASGPCCALVHARERPRASSCSTTFVSRPPCYRTYRVGR